MRMTACRTPVLSRARSSSHITRNFTAPIFPSPSTNPRQRVPDEHVYHAGAAELGVHYDHARRFLGHLAGDSPLCLPFDCVRGFESGSQHSLYETFRSRRSAIQTLIMDWRVTPRRLASRSRDWIIHEGKSTLTRRCSCPGLRIFDRSRSAVTSPPSSNLRSKSLAFIDRHLLNTSPADRDEPDPLTAVGNDRGPVLSRNHAHDHKKWLVFSASRNFHEHLIEP